MADRCEANTIKIKSAPHRMKLQDGQDRWAFDVDGSIMTAASLVPRCKNPFGGYAYLLVQVHDNGTRWQTTGGKVDEHDLHWKNTAMREYLEETGYCLPAKDIVAALTNGSSDVVYVAYAKHGYWFHDVPFNERHRWSSIALSKMSPEDQKKIMSVNWIKSKDLAGLDLRPDVKCALEFMDSQK